MSKRASWQVFLWLHFLKYLSTNDETFGQVNYARDNHEYVIRLGNLCQVNSKTGTSRPMRIIQQLEPPLGSPGAVSILLCGIDPNRTEPMPKEIEDVP